jgi:hypothetical protein
MVVINGLVLFLIGLGPVGLAVGGYAPAGGLLLVSLVVVLLAINVSVDRFEELTFGPLRAKLREKIREADELSANLKEALRLMLSLAVTSGMRTGRFAHEGGKLHQQVFEQVQEIAKTANFSSAEVEGKSRSRKF